MCIFQDHDQDLRLQDVDEDFADIPEDDGNVSDTSDLSDDLMHMAINPADTERVKRPLAFGDDDPDKTPRPGDGEHQDKSSEENEPISGLGLVTSPTSPDTEMADAIALDTSELFRGEEILKKDVDDDGIVLMSPRPTKTSPIPREEQPADSPAFFTGFKLDDALDDDES